MSIAAPLAGEPRSALSAAPTSYAPAPLALALAVFALCAFSPSVLNDGDTFSHIATGQWILEHRAVPHSDPFTFSFAGAPWTAHEWLSEVFLALAYRAGRLRGRHAADGRGGGGGGLYRHAPHGRPARGARGPRAGLGVARADLSGAAGAASHTRPALPRRICRRADGCARKRPQAAAGAGRRDVDLGQSAWRLRLRTGPRFAVRPRGGLARRPRPAARHRARLGAVLLCEPDRGAGDAVRFRRAAVPLQALGQFRAFGDRRMAA